MQGGMGGWGGDNAKQKLLQTIVAMKDAGTTLKRKTPWSPRLAENRRVQEKNVSKTTHKKEPTHIKQKELKQHNNKQVEGEEMLIEACRIGTLK